MSPDMEIVSSLNPDWILAPSSLETDLKPKFEELKNTEYAFLNLRSDAGNVPFGSGIRGNLWGSSRKPRR